MCRGWAVWCASGSQQQERCGCVCVCTVPREAQVRPAVLGHWSEGSEERAPPRKLGLRGSICRVPSGGPVCSWEARWGRAWHGCALRNVS